MFLVWIDDAPSTVTSIVGKAAASTFLGGQNLYHTRFNIFGFSGVGTIESLFNASALAVMTSSGAFS